MAARKKAAAKRPVRRRSSATKKPAVRQKIAAPRKKAPSARRKAATRGLGGQALRLAGVGSEAVRKATGRAWDEWLKVLDRAGAKGMPHKEIAQMLFSKFSVPGWWSQMVTVGYEQARGLRKVNQNAQGFSANASRTLDVGLDKLYASWTEPAQRSKWLPDAPVEIRTASHGKSLRMTWTAGGSSVDVGFIAKGPEKSQVQVSHNRLANERAVERQKSYWTEALERLKTLHRAR
jgi:hypothetical protein